MNIKIKKKILRGMITDFDGMYGTKEEMEAYADAIKSFIYHSCENGQDILELMKFYEYCLKEIL